MKYQFYTLDVFTDKPFKGNQLAVFPHSEGLSDLMMKNIAREFNFSETVFIFPPSNQSADFQVRIFTPGGEIPFAGHPTIGAGFLLAYLAMIPLNSPQTSVILEEKVGNIPVTIYSENGIPHSAELKSTNTPEFFDDIPTSETLAEVLSLSMEDLHPSFAPKAVSCGLPFLIIPVNRLSALQRAKINLSIWQETLKDSVAPHVYPCYPLEEYHWRVRMFAPALNITEDPATGSAATAFASYLARYQPQVNGSWQWLIEQGIEMGRASKISAIALKENNQIKEVKVRGECVMITEGCLLVQ